MHIKIEISDSDKAKKAPAFRWSGRTAMDPPSWTRLSKKSKGVGLSASYNHQCLQVTQDQWIRIIFRYSTWPSCRGGFLDSGLPLQPARGALGRGRSQNTRPCCQFDGLCLNEPARVRRPKSCVGSSTTATHRVKCRVVKCTGVLIVRAGSTALSVKDGPAPHLCRVVFGSSGSAAVPCAGEFGAVRRLFHRTRH